MATQYWWNSFQSIARFLLPGGRRSPTAYFAQDEYSSSRAGVLVTPEQALENDTVFSCVNLISDTIAQTDCYVVDKTDNYSPRYDHAVSQLLYRPNPIQTKFEFIKSIIISLMAYGNAFVLINGVGAGRELILLPSRNMRIGQNEFGRPVFQAYDGNVFQQEYTQEQIIHFRDVAIGNIEGLSRVMACADLIGQSIALDNAVSDILRNAARVSGILTTDAMLDVNKKKEIAEGWKAAYGANNNAGGQTAILDAGLTYQQVEFLTVSDADAINLKSQLINRCAAVFRVPAQYLEQTDSNKYNNVSQKKNSFYSDTLAPLLTNIEQKLTQKLLQRIDRNLEIRFDRMDLVKGDLVSQIGVATQAVSNGIWTNNEARAFLGYDYMEQEGADELTMGAEPQEARTDMPGAANGSSRESNIENEQ